MRSEMIFKSTGVFFAVVFFVGAICSDGIAQSFPTSPISIIVAHGPGGGGDIAMRIVGAGMQKYLKVPLIINNVTGGGSLTGMITLFRAKPDGYTIGLNYVQQTCAGEIFENAPYKVNELEIIGQFATVEYVLGVPKNSPFLAVRDFKKARTPVRFACSGTTSNSALVAIALGEELGFPVTLVTGYKGAAESIVGAMKGEADAVAYGAVMKPFIQRGDLRGLVVFASKRFDYIPNVPTLKEEGISDGLMSLSSLNYVLWAPPKTPKEKIKVLQEAMIKATWDKKEALINKYLTVDPLSGEKTRGIVNEVYNSYKKVKPLVVNYMKKQE